MQKHKPMMLHYADKKAETLEKGDRLYDMVRRGRELWLFLAVT